MQKYILFLGLIYQHQDNLGIVRLFANVGLMKVIANQMTNVWLIIIVALTTANLNLATQTEQIVATA